MPATSEEWKANSKDFMDIWGFPHAVGAIDGEFLFIIENDELHL